MTEIGRRVASTFFRQVAVAVVTGVVLLAFIMFVTRDRQSRELELQETLVKVGQAQACVLALPVGTTTGRNDDAVRECFTQYGLDPPRIVG